MEKNHQSRVIKHPLQTSRAWLASYNDTRETRVAGDEQEQRLEKSFRNRKVRHFAIFKILTLVW